MPQEMIKAAAEQGVPVEVAFAFALAQHSGVNIGPDTDFFGSGSGFDLELGEAFGDFGETSNIFADSMTQLLMDSFRNTPSP